MCERRLVIVRDWAPLLSGKSRDEEGETARVLDVYKRQPYYGLFSRLI